MFSSAHRRACLKKQKERDERIASLPPEYRAPITLDEERLLSRPAAELIAAVQAGALAPPTVLLAYGKKALKAHAATNCLTECNTQGPLAGMPVSVKDTVAVAGEDACIGYSAWVGRPAAADAAVVRLLRDAGAVVFVKTNVPTTLLSLESANDAALLAYGGSRLGIGTDVAGSVRAPAHYSGVYAIKSSMHRFLKTGNPTSMPGQEGIPATYSPMARTLEDLETFWRGIFAMKPWEYDHSVLPIPWREVDLASGKPIRWAVLWDDGVVAPSPACKRALETVVSELKARGHDVVDLEAPSAFEGLEIGAQLLLADAAKVSTQPLRRGETNDPGVAQARRMFAAPRAYKRAYAWYLRAVARDPLYAALVGAWSEKTVPEYLALGCGYTFLWNVLDYTAGVMPVTHVDRERDGLDATAFKARNAIERGMYGMYDAGRMHGLPVGVQVVGRRLEEEKVLAGMKLVEGVLREAGKAYVLLETKD
ncbi:amidase signature enzyme [Epithele typhae]|uniref:amidase signature enzyme n=1 Tax=Epithele typhae TaxID=378194 RepID=UPI002007291C|nr:amidase signature enzyme [Epithele typhae]KAH9941257.1 amidase signature enzyme [Epithele typhae]